MKRKLEVRTPGGAIVISATIDSSKIDDTLTLNRDDIESIRDSLADQLQDICARLPYVHFRRHQVIVR